MSWHLPGETGEDHTTVCQGSHYPGQDSNHTSL